jgi:hypothetical protein
LGVLHNLAVLADTILQFLAGLAALALSARLALQGSSVAVRVPLLAYLAVSAAEETIRFTTFHRADTDFIIYAIAEPLKLVAALWLFWGLTAAIFAHYPAIGSFVTKFSKYLLPACAGLGAVSFLFEPSVPPGRNLHLHLFIAAQRAATTGLLGFLIFLSMFSTWFPVRLSSQLRGIVVGFLAILGTNWSTALIANAWMWAIPYGNILYSGTLFLTSIYWLAALWAPGQSEAVVVPRWDPERLARMRGQLDALQAQLSRRGF